jgi:hypothetical protein
MKARFLLGPGGGRRGPHRVGVGRGLHQPAEDRLRPKLRPAARRKLWCCWGSCSRRPSCSSCRGRPRRWWGRRCWRWGLPPGGVVAIQLLRLRSWGTIRPDLRGAFVLRVALGQVATLPLVIAGVAVLAGGPGGLYWLVPGTVFPILVALFAAWVLLVEINR